MRLMLIMLLVFILNCLCLFLSSVNFAIALAYFLEAGWTCIWLDAAYFGCLDHVLFGTIIQGLQSDAILDSRDHSKWDQGE
jgi:signal transduction histidine kinase